MNFIYALFSDGFKSTGASAEIGPGKEMGLIGIFILLFIFLFLYSIYAFKKIREYIREHKADKKDDNKRE